MTHEELKAALVEDMDEMEAVKLLDDNGALWRAMSVDGESFCGTCDFNSERFNLTIENGKLISYYMG